jgi:hypothetical protein
MTTEFLFFADVVLLLRLRLLLSDSVLRWRSWLAKGLIEIAVLSVFEPHAFLIGAGLTTIALNLGAGFWDQRVRDRNGGRLLFGIVQLAAMSVWFCSAGGVHFREELPLFGNWLDSWSALGAEARRVTSPAGLRMLFGFLLAANEANLLVRWWLGRLQIKPGNASVITAGLDTGEFNRGRVIGLLERVLIYAFVLSGQFGAIGFTLAAKGFTRFKELENRGFAEYVLIGTLLSSTVALAIGAWIKLSV